MYVWIVIGAVIVIIAALILMGIRIVRPTHRGLVERLGKYNRFCGPGFHVIIPGIERMFQVDIREVLVEAQPQTIITNDNLNARVDAQVYLKVKPDEENVKASQYNVTNYENQIVNLARTTLRNIIGTMSLKSANSERGRINEELRSTLKVETGSWGIEILRTELKEIDPPAGRAGDDEQGRQGREREDRRRSTSRPRPRPRPTAPGAPRSRRPRASGRRRSSPPRARRRRSSW